MLFDLEADPSERNDLSGSEAHAGLLQGMRALMDAANESVAFGHIFNASLDEDQFLAQDEPRCEAAVEQHDGYHALYSEDIAAVTAYTLIAGVPSAQSLDVRQTRREGMGDDDERR